MAEPTPSKPSNKSSKKNLDDASESEKPATKKKKKTVASADGGTGASKLEETPVLDTYEARQRVRWIIGGLLSTIGLIALFIVLRAFKGNGDEEIRDGEPPDPRIVRTEPRTNLEVEARKVLETAKQTDKNGKHQAALDLLDKLAKNYQGTAAAKESFHAIERARQKKSLFGPDTSDQASGPKAPAPGTSLAFGPVPPKAVNTSNITPAQPLQLDRPSPSGIAVSPAVRVTPSKPLPNGFRPKPDVPVHSSGWPTRIICERDEAELVLVPGGMFNMGREDGESSERPVHEVTLSSYYIDLHEVTVRQYTQFLKETGRPLDTARFSPRETAEPLSPEDFPVVNVSAREAKAYCIWARRKLPTEAQWELAARGPNGRISFWNGEIPRKDLAKGIRLIEPVMTLPSDVSAFGAYDMGINAWEWTSEYYDSHYYQQFRKPVVDPAGPKESRSKLVQVTVKGGSKSGILTWRDGQKIEARLPYLGFRGALPVEGAPSLPPSAAAPSNQPVLPGGVVPF